MKRKGLTVLLAVLALAFVVWRWVIPKLSGTASSGTGGTSGGAAGADGSTVEIWSAKGDGEKIASISVDSSALAAYKNRTATRDQLLSLGKPFIYEALAWTYGPGYKYGLSPTNNPGPYSKSDADFVLASKTAAQSDAGFPVAPYGTIGPFNKESEKYGFALTQMQAFGRPRILPVE